MNVLRRIIAPMGTMDAIEFINSKLKDTKNNAEFFNSMNKPSQNEFEVQKDISWTQQKKLKY